MKISATLRETESVTKFLFFCIKKAVFRGYEKCRLQTVVKSFLSSYYALIKFEVYMHAFEFFTGLCYTSKVRYISFL